MKCVSILTTVLGTTFIMSFAFAGGNESQPPPPGLNSFNDPFDNSVEDQAVEEGFVVMNARWENRTIEVCWENLNLSTKRHAEWSKWTQEAIRSTWEAHSDIRFVGWKSCTRSSVGIRIKVSDENPHVVSLGSSLNGIRNGMVLNFEFNRWGVSVCKKAAMVCAKAIAAHEFGHALGFAHEQNRIDAPEDCAAQAQGDSTGAMAVGPFNRDSIMSYCGHKWNNGGQLNSEDIHALEIAYPLKKK